MTKCRFLIITAIVTIIFQEALSLKCWRCSTDGSTTTYCNDPYDEMSITPEQLPWTYVECSVPNNAEQYRSACKKTIEWKNGKREVFRSCFLENINDPNDECSRAPTPPHVKIEYCQTCITDGCNGKSMNPVNFTVKEV